MRISEFLTELSNREKARRAKLSAQSKRVASALPAETPAVKKGVPKNVPPNSNYITNKPLKKQTDIPGIFSNPEFDQFREPEADPNEGKGVVLRFHVKQHDKTANPVVYGYWAHDYALDFNDSERFGTTRLLGEIYSELTVKLVDKLVNNEHNVNIVIDPLINRQFPTEVKQLGRWATSKKILNKYQGSVNFEIDTSATKSSIVNPIVNIPKAEVRIPNEEVLSNKLMQFIRKNPSMENKYKAVAADVRSRALKAGIITLHKTNDIAAALDDIDAMLD